MAAHISVRVADPRGTGAGTATSELPINPLPHAWEARRIARLCLNGDLEAALTQTRQWLARASRSGQAREMAEASAQSAALLLAMDRPTEALEMLQQTLRLTDELLGVTSTQVSTPSAVAGFAPLLPPVPHVNQPPAPPFIQTPMPSEKPHAATPSGPFVGTGTALSSCASGYAAEKTGEKIAEKTGEKIAEKAAEKTGPQQGIAGSSPAIQAVLRMLDRVAHSELTVLISGESGTGKELLARALWQASHRAHRPFVALNCGALPENLLESELFGVEKGAFTGAHESRPGLLQSADGGTLFLDEVGEMSLAMQVRLLRVLQEGEVRPVGSQRTLKVNVRIIAATHQDLRQLIEKRLFREDLYYRLRVIPMALPPLRERLEDLPLLAEHLLMQMPRAEGGYCQLTPEAIALLQKYPWPGNIRELRAVLNHAVVFSAGPALGMEAFGELIRATSAWHLTGPRGGRQAEAQGYAASAGVGEVSSGEAASPTAGPGDTRTLNTLELEAIRAALNATQGNKSEAARRLGIARKTLYDKLARAPEAFTHASVGPAPGAVAPAHSAQTPPQAARAGHRAEASNKWPD